MGFGDNGPGHRQEQSRRGGLTARLSNSDLLDQPWEGHDLGRSSSQGKNRFMEKQDTEPGPVSTSSSAKSISHPL